MTSVVYIVQIGPHLKIGFSRNMASRLKQFATSAVTVETLLVVPGDRPLERQLQGLLSEARITRELFRHYWRIYDFIDVVKRDGLDRGLQFLSETTPRRRVERRQDERRARESRARQSKAALDAHFAGLVADRKRRLGW